MKPIVDISKTFGTQKAPETIIDADRALNAPRARPTGICRCMCFRVDLQFAKLAPKLWCASFVGLRGAEPISYFGYRMGAADAHTIDVMHALFAASAQTTANFA